MAQEAVVQILSDEEKVSVKVRAGDPVSDWTWTFSISTAGKGYALLLAHNLRKSIEDTVEAIRKQAYAQGWKDAKAHKVKETWFSRHFGVKS